MNRTIATLIAASAALLAGAGAANAKAAAKPAPSNVLGTPNNAGNRITFSKLGQMPFRGRGDRRAPAWRQCRPPLAATR